MFAIDHALMSCPLPLVRSTCNLFLGSYTHVWFRTSTSCIAISENVIFDLCTISTKGCCVVQMVYAAYYQVRVKTKQQKSLRLSTIIVGAS